MPVFAERRNARFARTPRGEIARSKFGDRNTLLRKRQRAIVRAGAHVADSRWRSTASRPGRVVVARMVRMANQATRAFSMNAITSASSNRTIRAFTLWR